MVNSSPHVDFGEDFTPHRRLPTPTHLELGSRIDIPGREDFPWTRGKYEHPTDPTKLIRHEGMNQFTSPEHMVSSVEKQHAFFDLLSRFGIRHVNPQYYPDITTSGDIDMYTVVDKIEGISMEALLNEGQDGGIPAEKYDELAHSIITFVQYLMDNGGEYSSEMLRLEQFMYDPAAESFVLVDIEPNSLQEIPPLSKASDSLERNNIRNVGQSFYYAILRDLGRLLGDVKGLPKTKQALEDLKAMLRPHTNR